MKRILRFGAALATLTLMSSGLLPASVEAKRAAFKAGALTDWPTIVSPIRKDPAMERTIAEMVAGMTLEQKIGQMTQAEIKFITPEQIRAHYIGSVLNGGGSWPNANKHATPAEWAALSDKFYRASMATDMKVPVPVIWGIDAVHGHNNVLGAVLYPHNIGLGAAHDPLLIRKIAQQTAAAVRETGITWVFAPTLAVVQNPRWGRTYEGYSSDPLLVRSYADNYVRGLQGAMTGDHDALATAKHFIGDGGTHEGKDQGETRYRLSDMMNIHAQGYYAALGAGVQTVMASYNSWNDVAGGKDYGKMHGSRELLTGVLKDRLGFDGFVISDWNAIEQVPGCSRSHCPQSINAGVDMVMVPEDWQAFIAETTKDVETGVIPMSRIDDAVTRILRVKMRSGLFAKSPIPPAASGAEADSHDVSRALAREAVRKSLVLLKNNSRSLPLRSDSRILVVGTGAASIVRQTGGWSMTWQGDENVASDFPNATNFLTAVRGAATGTVDYSPDGRDVDVSKYDTVIAVASETPYAEMKGDVSWPASLQHSDRYPGDLAMLKAVSGKGVPVITVMFSGRPTYVNDLINLSDAFVAAWLPGTEAQGITDALFDTKADFQGRLPFDWPGVACPDTNARAILFRRGYGLSYAKPRKTGKLPLKPAPNGCDPDRK